MYFRRGLATVALGAVVACDGSPTRPADKPVEPTGPVEPMLAQAASTGCGNRCGISIDVAAGGGQPMVFRLTESARLQGYYERTRVRFTWSLSGGTQTVTLGAAEGDGFLVPRTGNDWGQSVGVVNVPSGGGNAQLAAAWEPNGHLTVLRDGVTGSRVAGYTRGINDESVIVGAGALEREGGNWRPFRSHWRDGFRFLTPAISSGAAMDVNAKGAIVGHYFADASAQQKTLRWFLWTPEAGFKDMGPGSAVAISETGYVLGTTGAQPFQSAPEDRPFLYTPEGETIMLPAGWRPVDVNHWGEVALQAMTEAVLQPGDCGGAVWYRGYGLLRLQSPVADAGCNVSSINSWGDVGGSTSKRVLNSEYREFEYKAAVWTWSSNRKRYVQ